MLHSSLRFLGTTLSILAASYYLGSAARAQTLTWGPNGVGGNGSWNTANWFDALQNVAWSEGGNAIFAGASGGTVNSFTFGPVVSTMTFNTPGYVIDDGWIQGGSSGLTVTTNADAAINSTLTGSFQSDRILVKNGPGTLTVNGTNFMDTVQVDQGEVRIANTSSLFFSDLTLANVPGVTVTLAQSSSSASVGSLAGGGNLGGIVRPNNQARTVTLTIRGSETFRGKLEDNGSGILAIRVQAGTSGTSTWTGANTYSGTTSLTSGTLALTEGGSIPNSAISTSSGTLVLDNTAIAVTNRVSDSKPITMNGGSLQLKGNSAAAVEEFAGQLSFGGASTITVVKPGSATTKLTFAGAQRSGRGTLNVVGSGVSFAGLGNGGTGIVSPYITAGTEWAVVGGDSQIEPFGGYVNDLSGASNGDHVKVTSAGTTSLASASTRASLNLQNASAAMAQTVDLGGHSLGLTSGGILSSGAGNSAIQNGSLSTSAHEMVITTNNNLTINSSLVDSGSPMTLTKSGPGVLTLNGTNTYSGPTAIVQGTLVASSNANLGSGGTIELRGGQLQAGAHFSSPKGFSGSSGSVDTAGFDVTFSGANGSSLSKLGPGTLTLSNGATGNTTVSGGVLALTNASSGTATIMSGGTLQAAGTLSMLQTLAGLPGALTLDIGGPAAATLTTGNWTTSTGSTPFLIRFGIGSSASDFWNINSSNSSLSNLSSGAIQFAFQNLGGVTTGVDYPLMAFPSAGPAPSPNVFAFTPDMAAAGWAGMFKTTPTGVSVRFTAVPEPGVTAVLLCQGVVIAGVLRRFRKQARA